MTTKDEPAPPTPPQTAFPTLINGHEYVDLGSIVKWAASNIGASTPEEYGVCFAWAGDEKEIYSQKTYKYYI